MKLLGRGWQYSTYDTGNGRVLKKYNSPMVSYCKMFRDSFPYKINPPWKYPSLYKSCRSDALESIQIIMKSTLPMWMFGNPRYIGGLDYEQDFATPLRSFLSNVDKKEGERIIDLFVEFNNTLIDNSVVDRNFSLANNFSMNSMGNIILTDLGEILGNKEQIFRLLLTRPWAEPHVLYSLPDRFHSYFIEKMDNTFLKVVDEEKFVR